jgi:transposase InsO family protein
MAGEPRVNSEFTYPPSAKIFHNRRRRHSALDMRTPIEYEMLRPIRQTA